MAYPVFDIYRIQRRRDKLLRKVFEPRGETIVPGHHIDLLAEDLRRHLSPAIPPATMLESVRHLAGQRLTRAVAISTAWRLAGNLPVLRRGQAVPPWAVQTEEEWVPVVAIAALLVKDPRNRLTYRYTLRVLAGTPCPMKVMMFWSRELIGYLSRHFGFSAPWGRYPYQHPTELVGLRLMAKVDPERSRGQPFFSEYGATDSMVQWNRKEILRFRKRVEDCPNGWNHSCHRCVVGYLDCPGGTHRTTFVRQFCITCGEEELFDPDVSPVKCIKCARKERLA
jgi:hypothetical protein